MKVLFGALLALAASICADADSEANNRTRPHIVLIVADDLGWNDVGFHGMNDISTPNIDALFASGVALQRHYVTPICTPSRAALMTGKYPIHTGMQHGVLYGMTPNGLPLTETLLPQHLKRLGYKTHLVGKWHLGSYKHEYLPLNRGFDTHLGFWTGKIDEYDHTNMERDSWGFDFRRDFETAHDLFGKYATDIYTEEAVKIINAHDNRSPLFLMVSHSAVHSGNPYEPLRAPSDATARFAHLNDTNRQRFAGVLWKLDESVGAVVSALEARGLARDTVLLFTTDNGGPPEGFNDNHASNYPLRGTKNTLWEGGVRGASVLWTPAAGGGGGRGRVWAGRAHLVDWLPTLLHAAGNTHELSGLDGVSLWDALRAGGESPREQLPTLINIDDIWGSAALLSGDWKLLIGTNYNGTWDGWYGPSGRSGEYDVHAVVNSAAGRVASKLGLMPTKERILELRSQSTVSCVDATGTTCRPLLAPCLFNVRADPCERDNLADKHPEMVDRLLGVLSVFNRTALPPHPSALDPAGDPARWGRVYTNFGDYTPGDRDRAALYL